MDNPRLRIVTYLVTGLLVVGAVIAIVTEGPDSEFDATGTDLPTGSPEPEPTPAVSPDPSPTEPVPTVTAAPPTSVPTATAAPPTPTPTRSPTATPDAGPADLNAVLVRLALVEATFEPGQNKLTGDELARLESAAELLAAWPEANVRVVGFTTEDTTLARQRIEHVVSLLIARGAQPAQLDVVVRQATVADADTVYFEADVQ